MKLSRPLFALSMLALFGSANAISLASFNNFEDGTTQSWGGGSSPTNVTEGQASNNALEISATGGNLATFSNSTDWTGNFTAAGVTGIRAWFKNTGSNPLGIRLVLFSASNQSIRWTSSTALVLSGSDWVQHTFLISQANLTSVGASATYASSVSSVSRMMFRHDPVAPTANGSPVTGSLRIDNIQAVPEPASVVALSGAILALARRRKNSL
jgi:hypothetical protein